jgi:hypothetical protein
MSESKILSVRARAAREINCRHQKVESTHLGVTTMSEPQVNEPVKLAQDIPELGLSCGEIGVICSTWFSPITAYEVEFERAGLDFKTRALLLAHQIQPRPN